MIAVAMAVPIVVSVLLGATARRIGSTLPPATAARLLALGGVATALSLGFVLSLLAFPLVAQQSEVAELGRWSVGDIRGVDPVPLLAAACAVYVTGAFGAAVVRAWRAGRDLWLADATCRRLRGDAGSLVVVEDEQPDAYALAGRSGRIVVSTAMLRALPPAERRVLLAHEQSHLVHRHHLYVLLADLAAAADPALRPLAVAVRHAVERWADEDAASAVGDRRLTATAIARAALARAGAPRVGAAPVGATRVGSARVGSAMAIADFATAARTRALLLPPPRPRRVLAAVVVVCVTAAVAGATFAGKVTEWRVEHAQAAYAAADR